MIDHTHDASAVCWVEGANSHPDFPVQNLPLGIFSPDGGDRRAGCAIGDWVLDLRAAAGGLLISPAMRAALQAPTLNEALSRPQAERRQLRHALFDLLTREERRAETAVHVHRQSACALHLPAQIGDYTDFYAGIHHAENIGRMFRPDHPLLPNYKYVPIGYHGRASSVRASGSPVIRPAGQVKSADDAAPAYRPTRRLDFELELGLWIGEGNPAGQPIPIAAAPAHIAGFCLLNDWSARDIQAWEYQPLGPFQAKNFHTTISPWIVTAEALAPFRVAQPARPPGDPRPLDYLWHPADQAKGALALRLQVHLLTARMREAGLTPARLSLASATNLYWTVAQLVTHHASNGCNLLPGDLLGSGTISAAGADGLGSLMEMTHNGQQPLCLPGGEERYFLEDGDEVFMTARADMPGFVGIGFGECRGRVVSGNGKG